MINVSTIKTHMYCPMKLYLKDYLDEEDNTDLKFHNEIKNLRIDIQDLIQKNMRKISKEMSLGQIEQILSTNITEYIENTMDTFKDDEYIQSDEEIEIFKEEIISESYFNIQLLTLKSQKAMKTLQKDGSQIVEMFFANCMYTYLIRDPQINLIGVCDKIEIVNGHYYPIIFKNGNPPLKGVWDQDAIELVSHAILIEQEFNTEVFVGFVDYQKVGDRRPVIMDVGLRKSLFKILNEVNEITKNKKMPKVKINKKKCKYCEYENICNENKENN